MSQQYPYTIRGEDFQSHQDAYGDSYQPHSSMYQPSVRSSQEDQTRSTTSLNRTGDSTVHLPGKALTFLHSCGLDSSDLAGLAELPEHLITVETLPQLLYEIKERKLSRTSSTMPSTSQPLDETSDYTWESSSHTSLIQYPIDLPEQPLYPLPPEQVQTWQDRWGNPRRMTPLIPGRSSSTVPDYSVSKDSDPYYDTATSPEPSSHTFVDFGPRPLLSLKLEPPVFVPTRKEALDFNSTLPSDFPHVCHLCNFMVCSTKEWIIHSRSSEHANSQLELVKKYPNWNHTVESARKDYSEVLKVSKVPTRKEASDFNGAIPPDFPYLCILCNITVFSEKDWSLHVTGGKHAQSQLDLMAKYPAWNGAIRSSRRNAGHTSTDRDGTSKGKTSDLMSRSKDELRSRVVSFMPLPVKEGVATELTAIAKRFGTVRKSWFLSNRGYVEMDCLPEARKLVEHYSAKQLKLKGKLIKVSYSSEYYTLRDVKGNDKAQSCGSHNQRRSSSPKRRRSSEKTNGSPKRRHSSDRTHSSPKRKNSSERTHSSPKRRHSTDKTRTSPKRKSSIERTHSSSKRKHSSERTPSSPKRKHSSEKIHSSAKRSHSSEKTNSSRSKHVKEKEDSRHSKENHGKSSNSCHSLSAAAKDETTKSSADTEEKSVNTNYVESTDSDSDLEGLEVIADDGEDLAHDICDYESATSDKESLPSEPMDVKDIPTREEVKTGDDSPNDDPAEASNSLIEGQKFEDHEDFEIKEEDHDFLKNCVTLDEFQEENSSECQELDESKPSIPQPEDSSGKVNTSANPVSHMKQSEKEPESPKEESISSVIAKTETSQNLKDTVVQAKEEHDTRKVTDDRKEIFGKVLEVSNLPNAEDYTDLDFLTVMKRYGDVTHHVLFQSCKKGFVEMALASVAEEVAAESKNLNIALRGNVLKVTVSEKYCHLSDDRVRVGFGSDDEKIKKEDASKESSNTQKNDALNGKTDSLNESLETDEPVGTEFVRPVVGYFCNLCNVIYASEEEAKDEHCRTPSHHKKVKDHKEGSGSVKNKK